MSQLVQANVRDVNRLRRFRWPALGLLALAAAGAWLALRPPPPRDVPADQPPAPPPETGIHLLAEGLYRLGGSGPAYAYLIVTKSGLVLVDAGGEPDAATIRRQLDELGLRLGNLKAILLTHAHIDHVAGAGRLKRESQAQVYAGRGDSAVLRAGGPPEAFTSIFHMPQARIAAVPVDVELAGGETLEFADARIEVLATPGHTPGSLCFLLTRGGRRLLFTGDVINSPLSLGTYPVYLPPRYRGDAAAFLASLRQLQSLPGPDLLLPSHADITRDSQGAQPTPESWQAFLHFFAQELETLLARHNRDGRDFLDDRPKPILPHLHYLGDVEGVALYAVGCPAGLVLFNAPGGADLPAIVEGRLRALGLAPGRLAAVVLTECLGASSSGARALAQATGCRLLAPREGLAALRKEGFTADMAAAEEALADLLAVPVEAVPLQGFGLAPTAYRFTWQGQRVLVSPRLPVKIAHRDVPELCRESLTALAAALSEAGSDREAYLNSLSLLAAPVPQVWLPALPAHGQNANLYDADWADVLRLQREQVHRAAKLLEVP